MGKDLGWNRSRLNNEVSVAMRRIEHHKNNLNIKENGKISGRFGQMLNDTAKNKAKNQNDNYSRSLTKEENRVGKSVMPSRQTEEGFFAAAKNQASYQQKMKQNFSQNQMKAKIPIQNNAKEDLKQKGVNVVQQQPQIKDQDRSR